MIAQKPAWLCAMTSVVALVFAFAAGAARAQEKFPDHPINFIVPWGPGGGADLLARTSGKIMAQDQHVDELVQVGLRSRFAIRSRYSWQEGAQREFNGWLVPRYQDCWRARRARIS